MKLKNLLLVLTILSFITGCYSPLKGKIVDAETGKPIEGAVAMAEWTRTKGFGNTYTVSAKVSEAVSDKEGNFELDGCYSLFVDKPSLTIYKNGYVAWNSEYIFPDWKKRDGFEWKSELVTRMEKFAISYSYTDHQIFIYSSIMDNLGLDDKKIFISRYYEYEISKVIVERDINERKKLQR